MDNESGWILLIEDNPGDARIIRETLKETGCCSARPRTS